jgi:hypothetical protein
LQLLHLVEQPRVLDRDHRLIGEGGGELDLLTGFGGGFGGGTYPGCASVYSQANTIAHPPTKSCVSAIRPNLLVGITPLHLASAFAINKTMRKRPHMA